MRRALLALAASLTAFAAQAQDTVLVLDASNSMTTRLDGRARLDVLREATAGLGAALPPAARVGLMAFGHRRAADCADIELLAAPGRSDPPAFASAASLVARGRSPL
ncbi:vWA domain-containing protein, partial [Falsiroseomonas oryziterrae]|uniref:vWA domain-containing protein n=1 Tax=Falsiroseomonas oryziterrae TaxID=2911368 RepID=UPI001F38A4E4